MWPAGVLEKGAPLKETLDVYMYVCMFVCMCISSRRAGEGRTAQGNLSCEHASLEQVDPGPPALGPLLRQVRPFPYYAIVCHT